ncbi:hypothetical protein BIV57_02960 [Mangrovactinospora gilvigrisea]|uniref:DUF6286 domain-containing protein n=1 Tax=Mangrovactinospora gilvigrisea TaxID=1428644 RepID=A0A1J7BZS0_9ACTN|nr:hypothetical protein BIV57_02960 [Mangrovactinospora gilvigrisea]
MTPVAGTPVLPEAGAAARRPPSHILPSGGGLPGAPYVRPDSVPSVPPRRRPRRFRSERRLTSGLVAFVVMAASGVLLYDVVRVRGGEHAMAWRRDFAHQLAVRHPDDTWVRGGAAVLALLGLWLLVLALTPGLRALLPLRVPSGTLRGAIERDTAEGLLQESALRVDSIIRAEVRVKRRRAVVLAYVRLRDLGEARDELSNALFDRMERMGPGWTPRLTLKLRPVRR